MPRTPERIETGRLILRRFSIGDVQDVYAYASDPEWARYLPAIPRPYTFRDAEKFVAGTLLGHWETRPVWAIELHGKAVGGINLTFDWENRSGALGYSIARPHWGKGLMTEAAGAAIDAAFQSLPDLNRVWATADARNGASQRVMEKLGMVREALLRQHRFNRGEPFDEVLYGILREEWAARRTGG